MNPAVLIASLYVFVLAAFLGYQVISRVPPLLHTPLMSATNAISGISLIGSIVIAGAHHTQLSTMLGFVAVTDLHRQRGRRIRDHRPHAEDVSEAAAGKGGAQVSPANYFIEATYLIASVFFVLGLKAMSHPETARRGMFLAEAGMLAAIIGTLMHHEIVSYEWIIAGLVIGSIVGALMAIWVPMTAMPQRTALSHAFGALAAALVGIAEYSIRGETMGSITLGALGLEVMLGSLTTTGSLIAAGKLQGCSSRHSHSVQGPAYFQPGAVRRHRRQLCLCAAASGGGHGFLPDGGPGDPVRRDAGHPDRLGRHAGGDVAC